jgi:hypothetical protein
MMSHESCEGTLKTYAILNILSSIFWGHPREKSVKHPVVPLFMVSISREVNVRKIRKRYHIDLTSLIYEHFQTQNLGFAAMIRLKIKREGMEPLERMCSGRAESSV